jgi:hypothetical protein
MCVFGGNFGGLATSLVALAPPQQSPFSGCRTTKVWHISAHSFTFILHRPSGQDFISQTQFRYCNMAGKGILREVLLRSMPTILILGVLYSFSITLFLISPGRVPTGSAKKQYEAQYNKEYDIAGESIKVLSVRLASHTLPAQKTNPTKIQAQKFSSIDRLLFSSLCTTQIQTISTQLTSSRGISHTAASDLRTIAWQLQICADPASEGRL